MSIREVPGIRLHIAVALVSVAVIAWQTQLVQLLSITQWHHFTHMIISGAMLGFGSAGAFVSIFQKRLTSGRRHVLPFCCFAAAASMASVFSISQHDFIRFDSMLLFSDLHHLWRLIGTCVLLLVPFFFSALVICLAFAVYARESGRVYFSNLVGSGLGGIVAILLMWLFMPVTLSAWIALFPLAAGLILADRTSKTVVFSGIAACCLIAGILIHPPELKLSEFKGLSRALNLPDTELLDSRASPYGLVNIVSSSLLRNAPGLSLNYTGDIPANAAVFINGEWAGAALDPHRLGKMPFFRFTTRELPYALMPRTNVLVLAAGTGADVAHALLNGAQKLSAVESNPMLAEFMEPVVAEFSEKAQVRIKKISARTGILQDKSRYDLIVLPTVNVFGGSSGLNALNEQYHLTKEAFVEMLDRLNRSGLITVSTWIDYPYRNPLRILSSAIEACGLAGIEKPAEHIIAVKNWNTVTFMIKAEPFSAEEIGRIRAFCDAMSFDPLIMPGLLEYEREQHNKIQDPSLYTMIDALLESASARHELYRDYDFNVKPATDDKPWFFQFFRWKSIGNVMENYGGFAFLFLESGYLMLFVTFFIALFAAALLVIIPLFLLPGRKDGMQRQTFIYFSGLGVAYMFVEIYFIQKFQLYLGNPVYAVAAVVGLMLISSGLGSLFSQKFGLKYTAPVIIAVIALILVNAALTDRIIRATISVDPAGKILISALIIGPLAFLMGMPFPMGIRRLAESAEHSVSWAWGVNSCVSVVSAALATIISVQFGAFTLILLAAAAYLPACAEALFAHQLRTRHSVCLRYLRRDKSACSTGK